MNSRGIALDSWLSSIDGKLFIEQSEIDRFWKRAKAGEFNGEDTSSTATAARKKRGKNLK